MNAVMIMLSVGLMLLLIVLLIMEIQIAQVNREVPEIKNELERILKRLGEDKTKSA